jgi:hypothetical protein
VARTGMGGAELDPQVLAMLLCLYLAFWMAHYGF